MVAPRQLAILLPALLAAAAAQQPAIGYKPAADADSKKTILLKDFQPEPALHAAAHEIHRAKFPVIDVHTHTNDAVGIGDRVDPKEMVARMDALNIKTIVILTGMWGDKLQTIIDTMVKPYSGRFMVFTQFDWSKINDPQFPSMSELLAQRDRMFAKHPHTTFVALHFGSWPENLDFVEQTLQKFPNVMIETGAREGELGRQPRRARAIFMNYSDRIMFGTDEGAGEAMYENYFRWLETDDEYFPYAQYPQQGRWMIYGLGLPDDVLEKVYHGNAEALFVRFRGTQQIAK